MKSATGSPGPLDVFFSPGPIRGAIKAVESHAPLPVLAWYAGPVLRHTLSRASVLRSNDLYPPYRREVEEDVRYLKRLARRLILAQRCARMPGI